MKTVSSFSPRPTRNWSAHPALAPLCLAAALLLPFQAQCTESDDFDDGNDTGWTRYNPFAAVGANIVRWHLTNGAYRILTTAPSPSFAQLGPGRAGSIRSEIYSDFYISVDIVAWNNSLPQAAGILARIRNAGLGTTLGYAFTWSRGNTGSETSGSIDISRITNEDPTGVTVVGDNDIHFTPGKTYRLVFIGRGQNFEGRVYELPDLTAPKVTISGSDLESPPYESGAGGLVIYDNSTGGTNVCDVTFDNFYATDVEPPRLKLASSFPGDWELSWPAYATNFVLESSTTISATTWDVVPANEILATGDRFLYFFSSVGPPPERFFRLVRR